MANAKPNPQAPVRLAVAGIGAVRLGIPVETVVQAMPVPAASTILPRRRGALLGVVAHDGATVPVLDLARWVETGERGPGPSDPRLLILRAGGRTLALRVDALDGLADVPQSAIRRLHHDDHPEELFHSTATVPESGEILSLLDLPRLADLSMCWLEAASPASGVDDACVAPSTPEEVASRSYALLQFGALRLAIVATDLREVFPMPHLKRFGEAITGGWCLWRGRHLPVLAPDSLPGCPGVDSGPLLAVIEHEGLALGLPVQAVLALQAVAGRGERAAGAVTSTVYDEDGIELRLLDTAALFARYPEALLSRLEHDAGAPGTANPGCNNDSAYIVFEAGRPVARSLATAIGPVEHVLPLPSGAATGPGATMAWRGTALPLVDLRPPSGAAAGAAGHVLVAVQGGRHAGYVVTRVEMLIPAGSAQLYRIGGGDRAVEFVTLGAGGAETSYRVVNLAAA